MRVAKGDCAIALNGSAFDVLGEYVTMILAGNVALIARLLGFGVESISLAPFVKVSEAPTTGRGEAAAVLNHDGSQYAVPLPAVPLVADEEFKHFFGDNGAVIVGTSPQSLHCLFVRVEVKNAICAGFDARRFGEPREPRRNKRTVEKRPVTVAVRIGDRLLIGSYRRSLNERE